MKPPSEVPIASSSVHGDTIRAIARIAAHAAAHGLTDASKRELSRLMDALRPEDLGLIPPRPSTGRSSSVDQTGDMRILTQCIHESNAFEMVIFLFPANASIPLHDHPNMNVFSKVLFGSLAMRSYDWEQPPTAEQLRMMSAELARLDGGSEAERASTPLFASNRAVRRADTVLTPEAPTFCLKPNFANIHSFTALSDCAVLDLLLPPYDDEGRDCHYFVPCEGGDGRQVELRVEAPPASLVINRATYVGPSVDSALEVLDSPSVGGQY